MKSEPLICVKAKIRLFHRRTVPVYDGYRPVFNFVTESKVGGLIRLLDREFFSPGEIGVVEIQFLTAAYPYLGDDFGPGTTFTFDEGTPFPIGDGL